MDVPHGVGWDPSSLGMLTPSLALARFGTLATYRVEFSFPRTRYLVVVGVIAGARKSGNEPCVGSTHFSEH